MKQMQVYFILKSLCYIRQP